MARHLVWVGVGMGIKTHLLILASKLLVTSVIIELFLMYAEKHIWSLLILSGMINIIIFHFTNFIMVFFFFLFSSRDTLSIFSCH